MHRKPKAKLYLRFRTPEGKQSPYCPALFDHKSRIHPFWCLVSFREDEVSVAEATDVNHDTKCIRVDEKPYFGFKPKDCENRNVPISDALIAEIDTRAKCGSASLLFGNNGRPDGHLLRVLKSL